MFRGCKAKNSTDFATTYTSTSEMTQDTPPTYDTTKELRVNNYIPSDSFEELKKSISTMKAQISNIEQFPSITQSVNSTVTNFSGSLNLSNFEQRPIPVVQVVQQAQPNHPIQQTYQIHQISTIQPVQQLQQPKATELTSYEKNPLETSINLSQIETVPSNHNSPSKIVALNPPLKLNLTKQQSSQIQRKLWKINADMHKNHDDQHIEVSRDSFSDTKRSFNFAKIDLSILENPSSSSAQHVLIRYLAKQFLNIINGKQFDKFRDIHIFSNKFTVQQGFRVVQNFDQSVCNSLGLLDLVGDRIKGLRTKVYLLEDRAAQAADSMMMFQNGEQIEYNGELLEGLNLDQRILKMDLQELNVVNIDKLWKKQ